MFASLRNVLGASLQLVFSLWSENVPYHHHDNQQGSGAMGSNPYFRPGRAVFFQTALVSSRRLKFDTRGIRN
jgi:hypothetical protein